MRKSIGSVSTNYAFTGEWEDSTGLIHLRARYYNPEVGRFISRDEWGYNTNYPMSYNGWLYGYANPILITDPSGRYPDCSFIPPGYARESCEKYQPPNTNNYNEKINPLNVTWNPSVHVPPAIIRDAAGRRVPPGTNQAQYAITATNPRSGIDKNKRITGACGPISFAAILRTMHPGITANEVFNSAYDVPYASPNYAGYG